MKIGGQILWNVILICETSQIYFLMGRRFMKDILGNHFKGPIIPFGSLVENYRISAKDQSRIHQFGKKVLLGLFLGYCSGKNVYLPVFCFEGLISEFPKFTYRIPSPRASFSSQVKKNRKPD